MKRSVLVLALLLAACSSPKKEPSPYASLIGQATGSVNADEVFQVVENHAKCAGFHRAFANLASASANKAQFFDAAADDAKLAATELATATISKELAINMVNELARTHAARWAYLIEANAQSEIVQKQANHCFNMAGEQEVIIRDAIKAKYGFRPPKA